MPSISNLHVIATISNNDRIVILANVAGITNNYTITARNLANSVSAIIVDTIPNANSTVAGLIKVGDNLSITNGVLSSTGGGNAGPTDRLSNGDATAILDDQGLLTVNVIVVQDHLQLSATTSGCYLKSDANGTVSIHTNSGGNFAGAWEFGHVASDYPAELRMPETARLTNYDGSPYLTKVLSDVVPVTNTQSLGNATNQWQHLYVSNSTIYIANTPLTVTTEGELIVNGQSSYASLANIMNIDMNSPDLHVVNDIRLSGGSKIVDCLLRPLLNVNALDINIDGGCTTTKFAHLDLHFDGGAVHTVFGDYEAALDGGCSFNNMLSSQYLDGGSALTR